MVLIKTISKYSFSIIFTLILYPLHAQDTKNVELDKHRYFKEIRLGDNIEKWKEHLTKIDSSSSTQEYLFDLRYCCDKVFDRDVQYLYVFSKNDKIVSVRIYLRDFLQGKLMVTTPDLKIALSEMIKSHQELVIEFNNQFGEYAAKVVNEGELVKIGKEAMTVYQWKGRSTLLTMEMYLTDAVYGSEKDPATGFTRVVTPIHESSVIVLTDLDFLKAEKSAGF